MLWKKMWLLVCRSMVKIETEKCTFEVCSFVIVSFVIVVVVVFNFGLVFFNSKKQFPLG